MYDGNEFRSFQTPEERKALEEQLIAKHGSLEEAKTRAKGAGAVFQVGEELELNGMSFKVRKITAKDLVLRPVRSG
jgi:uncharacterized Zn finger protein